MSLSAAVYELAVAALSPLAGAAFLFSKRGRLRISERFGLNALPAARYARWWHAASLGEAQGLLPLIELEKRPCLLTVTSSSALSITLPSNVVTRIAPFDTRLWYRLLFRRASFSTLVVTETELWPGMLRFAAARGAHIAWVNMRLRQSSVGWYSRLTFLYEPFLKLAHIFAASAADAQRWSRVFPAIDNVMLVGNSKFDRSPSITDDQQARNVAESLFQTRGKLVVLGSIHPPELQVLLPGLVRLLKADPSIQVIVAPRHRERDNEIERLLASTGFESVRRSAQTSSTQKRVLLLDTFGELERCYSCASIAFVGGSLVQLGGHNPLEASQYGCPVLMGPHTEVVDGIVEELHAAGVLFTVATADEFFDRITSLLAESEPQQQQLLRIAESAKAVAAQHRGASARLHVLLARLDKPDVHLATERQRT